MRLPRSERPPALEKHRAPRRDVLVEHRLDRGADPLGERVHDRGVVRACRAVLRHRDRVTEAERPARGQGQERRGSEPQRGVRGEERHAEPLGEPARAGDARRGLLAADDRARDDRRARTERDLHEAAAPEPHERVAIAPRLAGAGAPLGEDAEEVARGEDSIRRVRARPDGSRADRGGAEDRDLALAVVEERAQLAVGRVLAPERVPEHERVPWHDPGVVRDDDGGPLRRDRLDTADLRSPPGRVEELDDGLEPLGEPRIHAERVEPLRRLEEPEEARDAAEARPHRGEEARERLAQLAFHGGEAGAGGEVLEPPLDPLERGVDPALDVGEPGRRGLRGTPGCGGDRRALREPGRRDRGRARDRDRSDGRLAFRRAPLEGIVPERRATRARRCARPVALRLSPSRASRHGDVIDAPRQGVKRRIGGAGQTPSRIVVLRRGAMARIQVLPPGLVNQIAAGEVVERPASVVKELVENALDAGARQIQVDVEEGGLALVRVADDGCGMDGDDALLALERHATSKLKDAAGLTAIATMGFRGEALPAIASVSRMRIDTADGGAGAAGTRLVLEGGRVVEHGPVARPRGTTIEVRDLFFNTPARRKFMRAAATEAGHASETVIRLALAHPEVGFTLRSAGRLALASPASAALRDRAAAALGRAAAGHLLPIAGSRGDVRVRGLATAPDHSEATGRAVYLFVNGRYVRDRGAAHAVLRA